jgi:hypothetical protein
MSAAKQKFASAEGEIVRPNRSKARCDPSLPNDFNRQWPETACIATLSQQIA